MECKSGCIGKLGQTNYLGPIAVAAYSYMSLVPIIQPPIMKLLTTEKENDYRRAYSEIPGAGSPRRRRWL